MVNSKSSFFIAQKQTLGYNTFVMKYIITIFIIFGLIIILSLFRFVFVLKLCFFFGKIPDFPIGSLEELFFPVVDKVTNTRY